MALNSRLTNGHGTKKAESKPPCLGQDSSEASFHSEAPLSEQPKLLQSLPCLVSVPPHPHWFLLPACLVSSISKPSFPGSAFFISHLRMNPHLGIYYLASALRHSPSHGPDLDLKYHLSSLTFKLSIFKLRSLTQLSSYHFLLVYFTPALFTDRLCPAR